MQKILFTGGSGLLALNWALHCRNEYEVILGINKRRISPTFASTISIEEANCISSLEAILKKIAPDIVINTAAITNIEYCEVNPDEAYGSNVKLASHVATVCNRLDISLVHISTDHLFSGFNSYMTEQETIHPLNVYAKTKALAEKKVSAKCKNSIILRTNFFGMGTSYRQSFTDQIIKELSKGCLFYAFEDVFFTPVLASDLADSVFELVGNQLTGVFNVASTQRISKYDFAILVAKIFGFQESLVKATKIMERTDLVQRPHDMSLSNEKLSAVLKHDLGTAEHGLRRLLSQLNHTTYHELKTL